MGNGSPAYLKQEEVWAKGVEVLTQSMASWMKWHVSQKADSQVLCNEKSFLIEERGPKQCPQWT